MENISFLVAFGAGVLSFLSPCVLSLVPVYLASLCGPSVLDGVAGTRLPVFLHSLSFIIGFALIFTALGAVAGMTGFAFNPDPALLNKVSGSLLIALGIFIVAAMKLPWLNYEKSLRASLGNTTDYFRSFLIGAVFSLGWTACVGPVLGGILALALNSATAWRGASLLAVYSLGLGLPFLVIGVAFDSLSPLLKFLRRRSGLVSIVSSVMLIAVGILVLTGNLTRLSSLAG